jgi:hypothetical protein
VSQRRLPTPSNVTKVLRQMQRAGFTVEYRKKHLQITAPDGTRTGQPATPGNPGAAERFLKLCLERGTCRVGREWSAPREVA